MKEYETQIIEKVNKPFKKADVIVYAVLIALGLLLFAFTLGEKPSESNGFTVFFDNKEVLKSDFSSNSVEIVDSEIARKINDNEYIIQTELGYNIIKINFEEKSVKVIDSDCGLSKECARMTLADGIIVCAPHKLVIKNNAKRNLTIG